jgi:hypothetical protein
VGHPRGCPPALAHLLQRRLAQNPRGQLVHQVARLERGKLSIAIAVLTDGNPSQAYGRETVRGIAARLV